MSNRRNLPIGRNNTHFVLGAVAAGLALALPRSSAWQKPLAAAAAFEFGMALLRAPHPVDHLEEDADEAVAPELTRSAMIDGVLMRWEEHGGGKGDDVPVVMVHGIPTNPRIWRYIIPRLMSGGVRCLAWEQVGFGWSLGEGLGRDISIPRQADYLRSWLRHLGIRRAVFVGHDVGGGVLQALLTTDPELFAGLVLADCVAYDNWPVPMVRQAQAMRGLIARLPPALIKPIFLAALNNLGHDNPSRRPSRRKISAALLWEPYARPVGPPGLANQLRHMSAYDTLRIGSRLRRLDVPARVVRGEEDPLGEWSGALLADTLGARMRRIPGASHFTPEDHPDIIAKEIQSVLRQVAGNPGHASRTAEASAPLR